MRLVASVLLPALSFLPLASSVRAQVIPNPLVRPQRAPAAEQSAPQTPDPQARGATAPAARASRAADGEGLAPEERSKESLSESLSKLYVSAVIGDRAVLRSLEVSTVPRLGGAAPASSGGSAAGPGRPGGDGGAGNTDVGGLRSQVHVVRNGEVLPFRDRTRLLVRVRDTTVTLFDVTDVPPGNFDPLDLVDRGFPVAFRGSVDSIQTLPPTAPALTPPGGGIDGSAFRDSRDTRIGIGSRSGGRQSTPGAADSSSEGNDR